MLIGLCHYSQMRHALHIKSIILVTEMLKVQLNTKLVTKQMSGFTIKKTLNDHTSRDIINQTVSMVT